MRRFFVRGPRIVTGRKGKNGGPVIEQKVELYLILRGRS